MEKLTLVVPSPFGKATVEFDVVEKLSEGGDRLLIRKEDQLYVAFIREKNEVFLSAPVEIARMSVLTDKKFSLA